MARLMVTKLAAGSAAQIESGPSIFFSLSLICLSSRDLSGQKTEYRAETDNSEGKKYEALYSVTRPRLFPCRY
jgi:hypothetical protein